MRRKVSVILILAMVTGLMSGCVKKVEPAKEETKVSESAADTAKEETSEAVTEAVKEEKAEETVKEETEAAAAETEQEASDANETESDAADKSEDKAAAGTDQKGSGKVVVYNWGEYIDPDVLTQFEDETGIEVIYDEFETNEIMYPKVAAGAVKYDLICPSDYMIAKMIEKDMLQPINFDHIPNYKNIDPVITEMTKDFDPEGKYSIPYCWGTVGILYNKSMIKEGDVIDSWEKLWDEDYADNILMQDSVRDAFMVAEELLGYDMNTTKEDEIKACTDKLIEQKPLVQAYVIDQVRDKMIGEEAALAVIYSGEALYTKRENEDLEYVIPKEGTNVWVDSWVMTKDAENVENAEKFLDFLCRPDIALKVYDYITYSTPNKAARELIEDEEIREYEMSLATDEALKNCGAYTYLGEEGDELLNEYWSKVKSS